MVVEDAHVVEQLLEEVPVLARHLPLGMREAGTVLPAGWPQWQADIHVIGFCQTLVIAVGALGAIVLVRRLVEQEHMGRLRSSMVLLLLSAAGRWLVAQ